MRRLELVVGGSAKFWEAEARGATLFVRFGRLRTAGRTQEHALGSAAIAEEELERLLRETLAKGYVEVGGPDAAPDADPAPRKAPAGVPVPGQDDTAPGTFAFTRAQDELCARGWPHLRVLTDEPIAPAVAQRKALAALQAIDPFLPTILPRDLARRVLLGRRLHPFDEVEAIKKRLELDEPVDEALLREVIATKAGQTGKRSETYVFRLEDDVLLFEAFLGTEPVAVAIVDHLLAAMREPERWGDGDFWIDHENANFHRVAPILGWLRLRLPEARWRAIVAPLREGNPRLPRYSATLRALSDDEAPATGSFDALATALQRRDPQAARSVLRGRYPFDHAVQATYVLGHDFLIDVPIGELKRNPKWHQERTIAEIGTIRAPGTLRVMAMLLGSRAASPLAGAWIDGHREFVEAEALPALAARPADAALVAAVRAHLGGEAQAGTPTGSLRKELASVFAGLPTAMRDCEDDPDRERATMKAAFDRYCEIRAALGEVTPQAYFTHQLALEWGAAPARVKRWVDLAVDVA